MTHRLTSTLGISAAAVALLLATSAQATVVEVGTEIGNGADAEVSNDGGILGAQFADTVNSGFFSFNARFAPQGPFNERLRAGLVRWDLSGVTEDFNDLASAGLKVHTPGQSRAIEIYGLVDGDAGEAWDEATMTWNNAPGLTPNPTYADITNLTGQVDTNRWTLLGLWQPPGVKSHDFASDKFTTSYLSTENPAGWTPAFPGGPDGDPPTNEGGPGTAVFSDDFGTLHDPSFHPNLVNFLQADTDKQVTIMFFPRDWQIYGGGDGNVSFLTKEHDHIGNPEELLFPIVTTPTLVMEFVAAALEGDLDGDGFVGIADLNIVLIFWNQNVTPGDLLQGDPTGEGFVGVDDLNIVLGNWNAGTPPANSAVPEPASLALLAIGGLAMCNRRRRA